MEFFSTVLAAGKEIVAIEPVVTWNLYLTAMLVPLSVMLLGAYLSNKMKQSDEKDARILALIEKVHIADLKCIIEKQQSHHDILCNVKGKVESIYNSMDTKVDKDDCDRLMKK